MRFIITGMQYNVKIGFKNNFFALINKAIYIYMYVYTHTHTLANLEAQGEGQKSTVTLKLRDIQC